MKTYYLIQVEGTLVEENQIPFSFSRWLEDWIKTRDVFLFSPLSYNEIVSQVRSSITSQCSLIFAKGGRVIVHGKTSKVLYENAGSSNQGKIIDWVTKHAGHTAKTEFRGSQFIRNQAGLISFSPVGYDIDSDTIKKYQTWDKKFKERARLLLEFQGNFPELHAKLDSTVGIEVQASVQERTMLFWFDLAKDDMLVVYCTSNNAQEIRDQLKDVPYKWQINVSNAPSVTYQTMKHYGH